MSTVKAPPVPSQLSIAAVAARAQTVCKTYGTGDATVHALDNVSVGIRRAEFTAIMGPSGSGKSTMLHVLAGLDRPTSGSIFIGDTDITTLSDKALTMLRRDQVGFIFQSFNLLPTMTAAENIVLPMRIAGRKPDQQWVDSIVRTVGLSDRLSHRPAQLSGGQQQRVAAARALASRPQIVFADEPTGALDSRSSAELLAFLRRAVTDMGQTVVMVTHDASRRLLRPRAVPDGRPDRRRDGASQRRQRPRLHEAAGGLTAMLSTTIRGMFAHKLRLALTTASIALGVAFLSGTLILTDTMHKAFDQLFGKVSSGTDAVVRQHAAFDAGDSGSASHKPLPASVLTTVEAVSGVRAAEGVVSGYALMTDTKGKAVLAAEGAPTNGASLPADKGLRGDVNLRTGHAPSGADQVAIDAHSADKHHIPLGANVRILFHGSTQSFTVVGTVTFGGAKDLGGSTSAYFDLPTAQRVLGTVGSFDQVNVAAEPGVSEATLTQRLSSAVPSGVEALTGAAITKEFSDAVSDGLGFVTVLFSVFAGIALFVGSFIIWNTFTMIVAQRSREIALLRAIGSTRGQVMRSVLLEATLVGLGASIVGLGLGVVVSKGLTVLMSAVGFSLPTTGIQLAPRTVVLSLFVGTVVTVVAAVTPARRATKVLPVEALRDATPGSKPLSRRRAVIGSILVAGGLVALFAGLFGGAGFPMFGLGMLLTVFGVTTLLPLAVRPVAAAIGWPLRLRGLPGELAQQNAVAQPAAHRIHVGRADDRSDVGRERRGARVVAEGIVRVSARRFHEG